MKNQRRALRRSAHRPQTIRAQQLSCAAAPAAANTAPEKQKSASSGNHLKVFVKFLPQPQFLFFGGAIYAPRTPNAMSPSAVQAELRGVMILVSAPPPVPTPFKAFGKRCRTAGASFSYRCAVLCCSCHQYFP
jgi:hypothetical protein